MTKSELIEIIAARQTQLSVKDVELAVKTLIEQMSETLASGERIEIRGFGSFSLHYRAPRIGRNPKTGESVGLAGKYVPHFKPGKELRDRVNQGLERDRALATAEVAGGAGAETAAAEVDGAAVPAQNNLFE
jgi:integration host factor subunit beta